MTLEVFRVKRRDGSYDYGVKSGSIEMVFSNDEKDMLINEWDRLAQERIMRSVVPAAKIAS
jgi:hypothetical protein